MLYVNGTWSGGAWTPLTLEGEDLAECVAVGINDGDEVIGWGQYEYDPAVNPMPILTHWLQPGAAPSAVIVGGDHAHPTVLHAAGLLAPGPAISNDGRIIGRAATVTPADGVNNAFHDVAAVHNLWTLPGNGRTAAKGPDAPGMEWISGENTYWGWDPENVENKGVIVAPGNPANLFEPPVNLVATSDGFHAFFRDGKSFPETFKNGVWKLNFSLGKAIDMAADGTVITATHLGIATPVARNGEQLPLADFLPGAPAAWTDNTVSMLDTTPGGWILAKRGTEGATSYGVLLPLRLEGEFQPEGSPAPPLIREGVGVDDISMTSSAPPDGTLNRVWIMAPSGMGETKVEIKTPAHASYPLEISGAGLEFDGAESKVLTGPETLVTIKAAGANTPAPGTEIPITVKLKNGAGSVESATVPLAAKVMKRRTIRVRVWRVKSDAGASPSFNPSDEELEAYLNKVYQPQINAVFDCVDNGVEIGPLNWDTATGANFTDPGPEVAAIAAGNGCLDFTQGFENEASNIRAGHYVSSFNINLYLVGGATAVHFIGDWDHDTEGTEVALAGGAADDRTDRREVWIPAEMPGTPVSKFDAVAHEIGHVILGDGHPNEGEGGVARLPRTDRLKRLMCSGGRAGRYTDGRSRIIVKAEWDKAKAWFDDEIDANRMTE